MTLRPEDGHVFVHEGRTWIARIAGHGAYGTGGLGLAAVLAIHFFDATAPDRPLREALAGGIDFETLFDAELVQLLEASTPIDVDTRQ